MIEFSELKEMPKALVNLIASVKNPTRSKQAYNYKYADLDEVLDCIKEPCQESGFSVMQMPYNDGDILGVETILIHESGEYIKARFGSKLLKHDPQSVGSQISYYRRYNLLAMFNMAQEDDDGATFKQSVKNNNNPTNNLASDAQKYTLRNLMGKQYDEHKDFIENKMTKKQASQKIEELMK